MRIDIKDIYFQLCVIIVLLGGILGAVVFN